MNEIEIPPRAPKIKSAPGTMDQPGRNHHGLASWLLGLAVGAAMPVWIVDPMIGSGFLWLGLPPGDALVTGCDIRLEAVDIARANGFDAEVGDARKWTPRLPFGDKPDLIAFSPPYPNADHDSGNKDKVAFVKKHSLAAMQTCPGTRNLLPVFLQIATYCGNAPVAVIVRNWIARGNEVDWVSEVEQSMTFAGFAVERFWRRILPGPTTQWKLKSGKQSIWIDREWVLVRRMGK